MTDGGGTLYTVRGGLLFPSSLFFSLSGEKKNPSICGKERGGRGWEKDEAVALSKCVVREGVSAAAHSFDGKDEISPKLERQET